MRGAPSLLVLALVVFAPAAAAHAQPAPEDFTAAARRLAASRARGRPCEGGARSAVDVAPDARAVAVGEPTEVDGLGHVGLVWVARRRADANGEVAGRLFAVTIDPRGRARQVEIPLGGAPFHYEDDTPPAHLEVADVDGDDRPEVVVRVSTQTEVECGTGHCTLTRLMILHVRGHRLRPGLDVLVSRACEALSGPQIEGDARFARHEDQPAVHLTQRRCAPPPDDGEPACEDVERWWVHDPRSDRFRPARR